MATGSTSTSPPSATDPDAAYDQLVRESLQASIYCNRWGLDAVAPGRYAILPVTNSNRLIAAWPIVLSSGGRRVVMPPMTQKLGILFHPDIYKGKYSEALSRQHRLIEQLIREIAQRCPQVRAVICRFHESLQNVLPFYWNGYLTRVEYTYVLDPLLDAREIWSQMRTSVRSDIRKAQRQGLQAEFLMDFDEFERLNRKTFYRQRMKPPVPTDVLQRLDRAVSANAQRLMAGVRDQSGRLAAAVYVAIANDVAYYLMGASEPELRNSGASKLALWTAIESLCGTVKTFDFEGSMIRSVEQAFRDMGGRQVPFFLAEKHTLLDRARRTVLWGGQLFRKCQWIFSRGR